jgi:hypothetical protein
MVPVADDELADVQSVQVTVTACVGGLENKKMGKTATHNGIALIVIYL